jgi:hypothetical protein
MTDPVPSVNRGSRALACYGWGRMRPAIPDERGLDLIAEVS